MNEFLIRLNTVDEIKEFVSIVNTFKADAVIKNEKYVVDAKSILGIFSLNLSSTLILTMEHPSEREVNLLKKYMVNDF